MEEVKFFIVLALYKKTILNANGQKDPLRQTIRIIKAKDRNEAKDKFNKFWAEKMRSFTVVSAELTEVIE